jgi:hypothetical protein
MGSRRIGLTPTYQLVVDPSVRDADVAELRRLHRAVDRAVVLAYGWPDLLDRLDHGFHPVGRELRYTIGPAAQQQVLERLLALNRERHSRAPDRPPTGSPVPAGPDQGRAAEVVRR